MVLPTETVNMPVRVVVSVASFGLLSLEGSFELQK